ncbi:MAG: glucuronate isomerase [Sphaerochaetaceae bacterium]
MKPFLDDDFLLNNEVGKNLFHTFAKGKPIFDYHCHLNAQEIYENKPFTSLGELWFAHDHYKWRLIRANGVEEKLVTGASSYYEKYLEFAKTLPYAIGNPVYHWTHLELQRYFSIDTVLDERSAPTIWKRVQEQLVNKEFSPRSCIASSNVHTLCTTEDPADSLEYHQLLKKQGFPVKVLPAWRPDKLLAIEKTSFRQYIRTFGQVCNVNIENMEDLKAALCQRMDVFALNGCVASDHDIGHVPYQVASDKEVDGLFKRAMNGENLSVLEQDQYKTSLLIFLAQAYHQRNWVMELHIGCNRSQNTKMVEKVGEACGFDSTGDYEIAYPLGKLLNAMESNNALPKTVLFCLNPKDNWILASLANTFQDAEIPSKIQFGTAWWMQDHKYGMEQQLTVLANSGLLGRFIGMLTDSRSYLSYSRHEYFRRILCNLIGSWVEGGEYPYDRDNLGRLIEGICFDNALQYFQTGVSGQSV